MRRRRETLQEYWNREDVESMYDKHLLNAEIELIKQRILPNTKVLDVGCGEGEGTLVYSVITGVMIHAADFSETRLKKAAERLKVRENVVLKQVDFLAEYSLDNDYDIIISQRFLINLMEWRLQSKVLLGLGAMLKPGGRLVLLEGSKQGVASLNEFRAAWGLAPIPVKWHNLFFDDHVLIEFMQQAGFSLLEQDGLGTYFLLTRGIRPNLDKEVNWDCEFNRLAATRKMEDLLRFDTQFSRLKLWVFQK
jgi:ubiquinone/menaquinone biosynthesis C-methylase UbiE